MKGGRCPNGTRKNKKSGNCESTRTVSKKSRCPKGTRRNKYGRCQRYVPVGAPSDAHLNHDDIEYIIDELNLKPSAEDFIANVRLNRKYSNKHHKHDKKMSEHDNLWLQARAEVLKVLENGPESKKRELI